MSLQQTKKSAALRLCRNFFFFEPMGQHTTLLMRNMMHGLTVCPEQLRTHASYTWNHLHTLNLTQCEINCVLKNNAVCISYACFFFFKFCTQSWRKIPSSRSLSLTQTHASFLKLWFKDSKHTALIHFIKKKIKIWSTMAKSQVW